MNPQHDTDHSALAGEQVSALCDGHLDPSGVDALLARCRDRSEPLDRWHSYQLIGAVLRGEEAVVAGRDPRSFLAAVRAGIQDAPPLARPEMQAQTVMVRAPAANADAFRWKLASGFASVVAVAAIGWNVLGGSTDGGLSPASSLAQGGPGAPAAASVAAAPSAQATPPGAESVASRPLVLSTSQGTLVRDPALERLLAEHRQHGGVSAFQTSTGFIRNATYDADAR